MKEPMRLVLNRPSEGGVTLTQGTELYTPDGSKVTGIASVNVSIQAGGIVETTVVLNSVVIEYKPETA